MKPTWTKADKNKVYSITRQYIDELEDKGFIVRTLDKIEFTHSFHRHGYCRTYKYNSLFDLGISAYRLADGWQAIRETILHELCHAIAPYGAGHGKEWQEIADEVGKIYGIKSRGVTHILSRCMKTPIGMSLSATNAGQHGIT